MKEFIPEIIVKNINKETGEFEGFCFQLDLSGFTKIVDRYSKLGKTGLETLSENISFYLDMFFNCVYEYKGFISNIAGDSFTCIFEGSESSGCLAAVSGILAIMSDLTYSEIYGKLTLSYGKIEYGIIKNRRNVFYFRGKAIEEVFEIQKYCNPGDFILSEEAYLHINKLVQCEEIIVDSVKCYKVLSLLINESPETAASYENYKDMSGIFYPELEKKKDIFTEFREVVSIFIGLKKNLRYDELKETIKYILEKMEKYGGYFNSLDFSDKGGYALINFGAPVCWENNIERSCDFVIELIENKNYEFRIGMNYGVSYCGVLGNTRRKYYSCIGSVTNIAAKIMIRASENSIMITKNMYEIIKFSYKTGFFDEISLKGIYGELKIFNLIKKHLNPVFRYTGIYMGRNSEVEDGKNFINEALSSNKPGVFYIFGEKGIGKSRYTNEILKKDEYFSAIKIYLKGEFIQDISFSPIKKYFSGLFNKKDMNFETLIDSYFKSFDIKTVPEEVKEAFNLYNNIFKYLAGIKTEDAYFNKNKKVVFEGFTEYLKTLSYLGKIIIVIDDLHLFDKHTVSCLNYALRKIKNKPVVFLINSRYHENEKIFTPIRKTDGMFKVLELKPLKKYEVKNYLKNYFSHSVDEVFSDMIYSKTEGNPYYLEEYAKYLKENNYIEYKEKIGLKNGISAEIPYNIGSLIMNKYDRLEEEFKNLVLYASALGETFSRAMLYECMPVKNFFRYLDAGEELGFWYKINNNSYKFKHAIICEMIYSIQFKSTKRLIHKIIAKCFAKLSNVFNPFYYYTGYHYEIAGEKSKAAEYYEKAYNYYFNNYMNDEALEMLKKIKTLAKDREVEMKCDFREIQIFERNGENNKITSACDSYLMKYGDMMTLKEKIVILFNKASNLYYIKKYKDAEKYLYETLEMAESIRDEVLTGSIKGKIGLLRLAKADYDEAEKYIKEELYTGLKLNDQKVICSALSAMSVMNLYMGRDSKVERYANMVEKLGREINDKRYIFRSISNLGYIYVSEEKYEKALECYERFMVLSKQIGNRMNIMTAYGNLGYINMVMGKFEEFELYNKRRKELLNDLVIEYDLNMYYMNYGEMYNLKGDYEKAIEMLKGVYKYFIESERRLEMGYCTYLIAMAYYNSGNYEKALEYIDISIFRYEKTEFKNNKYMCGILRIKTLYMIKKDFDIIKELKEKIQYAGLESHKAEILYDIWCFERTKENADTALRKLAESYEETKKYKLLKMKEEIENYYK